MSFLKNLFKSAKPKTGIVFIIEDNPAYSKMLEGYIKTHFPEIKDIRKFPVGETCISELNVNPDLIIVDYFLDTRYPDAASGLEIIKEIRGQRPEMNVVVVSAQKEIDVVLEAIQTLHCSYIKKDDQAFDRVAELIREI
jgi:two-component system OmpR family response regulator